MLDKIPSIKSTPLNPICFSHVMIHLNIFHLSLTFGCTICRHFILSARISANVILCLLLLSSREIDRPLTTYCGRYSKASQVPMPPFRSWFSLHWKTGAGRLQVGATDLDGFLYPVGENARGFLVYFESMPAFYCHMFSLISKKCSINFRNFQKISEIFNKFSKSYLKLIKAQKKGLP